jgi:hypothetical protein
MDVSLKIPDLAVNALITKLQTNRNGETSKHLYALAVAEDIATHHRAIAACRELTTLLGHDCEVIRHVWLLSELRFPELKAIAADEAFAADLIILSIHRDTELPDEIREWVDLWLERTRARPAVVLALLDDAFDQDDPSKPMHPYLEEVARKGNLEILFQSEDLAGDSDFLELAQPRLEPGSRPERTSPRGCETNDPAAQCVPDITPPALGASPS